jgi:hypothetical protein
MYAVLPTVIFNKLCICGLWSMQAYITKNKNVFCTKSSSTFAGGGNETTHTQQAFGLPLSCAILWHFILSAMLLVLHISFRPHAKFWLKTWIKDNFEDLEVHGRIILKWILVKYGGSVWIGLRWFGIGTNGVLLWARLRKSLFHKRREMSPWAELLVDCQGRLYSQSMLCCVVFSEGSDGMSSDEC